MIPLLAALSLPVFAAPPVQRGLLICPDPTTCATDGAWVETLGDGGRGGFAVLDFEEVITVGAVPDGLPQREAYEEALADARQAIEKGRWLAAQDATSAGIAAVAGWRGPVKTQELFELHFLRGVAATEQGRDASGVYSFRQAAAIADDSDLPHPAVSSAVRQAWLDEQRKLAIAGKGSLELSGGPEGTHWTVNGRSVPAGSVELWPGNHRVTATAPGHVRSWKADVPVLPERTSAIEPDFATYDEAAAVFGALQDAAATLDAPEPVEDLLIAWCIEHEVDELRLMRVEEVVQPILLPPVALSAPPLDRPAAAAGERVNMGDGVPTTFEGEVLERYEAPSEAHVTRLNRLRVVFFDPATRRFSADAMVSTALQAPPERLRLGVRTGGLSMMERSHLGIDLNLVVPIGPIELDSRLGLVRADAPYNLYTDWVDRQLYHLYLGARWAPAWTVAPFVGAGVDVFAPAAVGGRAGVGAQARFGRDWLAELELAGGVMDRGPQFGGTLGLLRSF